MATGICVPLLYSNTIQTTQLIFVIIIVVVVVVVVVEFLTSQL